MAFSTPVWLLDVDGVLNGPRSGWSSAPNRGYATVTHGPNKGHDFKMRWSAPLLAKIRSMHLRGLVEVRWCTTWCPERRQLEELFRLPVLEPALTDGQADPRWAGLCKVDAAVKVLQVERRPLIWTDDDAIPATFGSLPGEPPALILTPNERRCLRPEHLDYIEAWVERITPPPEP
jgi:hypothetical protein